ncbi:DUF512 domain-containing protein [Syntrophomonas erecta]
MGANISRVVTGSIADEMGLETGDIVQEINGHKIDDVLDYKFYGQDDFLVIDVVKPNGEVWTLEIDKDFDEDLGIVFDQAVFDRIRACHNRCLFCFVDQLPPNMRRTLYVKDDDYRYSFLYGNYITLTNLKDYDWDKITTMRLSPLYVSVHTTSPELRARMMNNPRAVSILEDLSRLQAAGIEVHTQIVLCPGINDGQELEKTINDLASFYPAVASVGIVPVGLTGHRQNLPGLQAINSRLAREIIDRGDVWQKKYRSKWGRGLVYVADEFYIKAGKPVPSGEYYDDYCQIENGIGLVRMFQDEFSQLEGSLPVRVPVNQEVFVLTGQSADPVLRPIIDKLNLIQGLKVHFLPVANLFFGGGVTVTGLLTGSDIIRVLGKNYKGKKVIIPDIVFKEGNTVFLDDISLEELIRFTGACFRTVDGTAQSLVEAIINP